MCWERDIVCMGEMNKVYNILNLKTKEEETM
jgi:hypothetical protein